MIKTGQSPTTLASISLSIFLFACFGNVEYSLASEPKMIPGASSVNLLPPHLIVYFDSEEIGEAERGEITGHGMTFKTVVAAVTDAQRHVLALDTGTLTPRTQTQPEQPRGLAEYLKLKGYRLMMLGNYPLAEDHDFAFENVLDSVNSLATPLKENPLAVYLDREVKRDHRPICLVVNSTGLRTFSPNAVFQASRKSLPVDQTIFVYTAMKPTRPHYRRQRQRSPRQSRLLSFP